MVLGRRRLLLSAHPRVPPVGPDPGGWVCSAAVLLGLLNPYFVHTCLQISHYSTGVAQSEGTLRPQVRLDYRRYLAYPPTVTLSRRRTFLSICIYPWDMGR